MRRKRWPLYLSFVPPLLWIAGIVVEPMGNANSVSTAGVGYRKTTSWEYASTQPQIILHYLRLVVCPHPLAFDYGWPVQCSLVIIALAGTVVLALVALSIWGSWRGNAAGFLGLAFFLVLAPTSNIVPIADLAFEHRMRLPLAAVTALVVVGIHSARSASAARNRISLRAASGLQITLLVVANAVLGWRTIERNRDYVDAVRFWSTVIAARPENARAWSDLGTALGERQNCVEAAAAFRKAVALDCSNLNLISV